MSRLVFSRQNSSIQRDKYIIKEKKERYFCNTGLTTLLDTLNQLVPACRQCESRTMHICTEQCCAKMPLFCADCCSSDHFLHDTNDLKLLFIGQQYYSTEKQLLNQMRDYVEIINQGTKLLNAIVNICDQLRQAYEVKLQDVEAIITNAEKVAWHTNLCTTVEKYLNKQMTLKVARAAFKEQLNQLNLYRNLNTNIGDPMDLEARNEELRRACQWITTNIPGDSETQIAHYASIGIDQVLKKFPFERFADTEQRLLWGLENSDESKIAESKLMHFQGRSLKVSYQTADKIAFEGDRIIISRGKSIDTLSGDDFSMLRQLHTEVQFQCYPKLKLLDLNISVNSASMIKKFPESVNVLMVSMISSDQLSSTQERSIVSGIVDEIAQLRNLKSLYVSFPVIRQTDLKRMIHFMVNVGLQRGCLRASRKSILWEPFFPRKINKEHMCSRNSFTPDQQRRILPPLKNVEEINSMHQRTLHQLAAIEKRPSLRIPYLIRGLLETCGIHQTVSEQAE